MSKSYLKSLAKRGLRIRVKGDKITIYPADKVEPKIAAKIAKDKEAVLLEYAAHLEAQARLVADEMKIMGYCFIWSDDLKERVLLCISEEVEAEMAGFMCQKFTIPREWGWQHETPNILREAKYLGAEYRQCRDPRPDLTDDHVVWERFLAMAEAIPELAASLSGLRSYGARLKPSLVGCFVTYDHEREGFRDRQDFQAQCERFLGPHRKFLREIGRQLMFTMKEA